MAKNPIVPNFGDWDNEDKVSYETYFNNARRKYLNRHVNGHERVKQPPFFNQKRSIVPRSDHWEYEDNVSHGAYDNKPQIENLEPLSAEKKPPVIPKFGNWEIDDNPYAAYFNNARKERLDRHVDGHEQPPSSEQKRSIEQEFGNRENEDKIPYTTYIDHHVDVHGRVGGPPSCGRVRPPAHSPNPSMFHLHYHAKPPSCGRVRPLEHSPNPTLLNLHYKTNAGVPKFGDWDENTTYDDIFKKVFEERATRSTMVSSLDAKPKYNIGRNRKRNNKQCCWFPWWK